MGEPEEKKRKLGWKSRLVDSMFEAVAGMERKRRLYLD